MRTSSYTIYVDLPENRDEMLLVHGYTGSYDRVSRPVANFLRSLEVKRPPKPLYGDWVSDPVIDDPGYVPSEATLSVLKRRGYLTEQTVEQELEFLGKVALRMHELNVGGMPGYIIMPTYNCNLRCPYCFQDHMRTKSEFGHLLRTMSHATVDRILLGLDQIEERHGVPKGTATPRNVGFFGGEPLLAASRPIVEYIMSRFKERGPAEFWAISNGTQLDAYEGVLGKDGISGIQITFDGPPQEHDRRRVHADGSGSWEKIARNIHFALEQGVAISARVNFDRNNIGDLPALAATIIADGWHKHPRFSAYAATIRAENEHTDKKSTFDSWELDQAMDEIRELFPETRCIDRPDDKVKVYARKVFKEAGAMKATLRESFCSAHGRMYIFDAFADIYACWDRTGDSKIRIGKIEEDGQLVLNTTVEHLWRSRTVASNPVCSRCRYALHCGGGCAVLAEAKTGKAHMNFCDGFANRFRSAVAEAYVDHVGGVEMQKVAELVCDQ
jgi:uncharacterized protein